MIVDWERLNLTIGQASSSSGATQIVPLLAPTATPNTSTNGTLGGNGSQPAAAPAKGVNAGMIAGIVVALIAIASGILGFWFFFRRRRRQQRRQSVQPHGDIENTAPVYYGPEHFAPEKKNDEKTQVQVNEVPQTSELEDGYNPVERPKELDDTQIHEMSEILATREAMSTPIMELEGDKVGSELDVSRAGLPRETADGDSWHQGDEDASTVRNSRRDTAGTMRNSVFFELDSVTTSRVGSPEPQRMSTDTQRQSPTRALSSDSISLVLTPDSTTSDRPSTTRVVSADSTISGMLSPAFSIPEGSDISRSVSPEPMGLSREPSVQIQSAQHVSITRSHRPAHLRTLSSESTLSDSSDMSARVRSPVPSSLSRVQSVESLSSRDE